MRAERFQFGNLILQGLKESPAATQLEQKECHERLLYELRKIRDMVQDIVCRKSRQEIAIKERNIRHYDEIIRQ